MVKQPAKALAKAAKQTGKICPTTGAQVVDLTGAPFEPVKSQTQPPPVQKSMIGEQSAYLPPVELQKPFIYSVWQQTTQQHQSGGLQSQTPEQASEIRNRQILAQKRQLVIGLTVKSPK